MVENLQKYYLPNFWPSPRTLIVLSLSKPHTTNSNSGFFIRKSVNSLCRYGTDSQYMQYLSKSHITSHKYAQQDSYRFPKGTRKTAKRKSVWHWKYHFCYSFLLSFFLLCSTTVNYRQVQVLTMVFAWNCLLSLSTPPWPISIFITINSFWSMKLFMTLPTAVHYIRHHFLMLYAYTYIVSFPNRRQLIGLGIILFRLRSNSNWD